MTGLYRPYFVGNVLIPQGLLRSHIMPESFGKHLTKILLRADAIWREPSMTVYGLTLEVVGKSLQ